MFKRIGSLVAIELMDEKELKVLGFEKIANLANEWKDIVKKSFTEPYITLKGEFDTDSFLYFKCRAISGGEKWGPNGNGDYFPWKEIKDAVNTFVSKGFYIEHDSDDPVKAKGIIVKADIIEPEEYVECIVAVSKKDHPDLCEKIKSGKSKSVSMGCLCQEAECSICNNIAHNEHELCAHMKQWEDTEHKIPNPQFIKGKIVNYAHIKAYNGKTVAYEVNRKICFNELSDVKQPADGDADIYANTIIAAKKKEVKDKIMTRLSARDFRFIKKAIVEEDEDIMTKIEDMVNTVLDRKLDQTVTKVVKEEVTEALGGDIEQIEKIVRPEIKEEVVEKRKDVKKDIEELREEVGTPTKPTAPEKPKEEKIIEVKKKETEEKETKPSEVKVEQIKESTVKEAKTDEEKAEKEKAKEIKKDEKGKGIKDDKEVIPIPPIEKPKLGPIILGDGFELRPEKVKEKEVLRLFDRDNPTEIFVDMIMDELSEADKIAKYRQILNLKEPQVITEDTKQKEVSEIMSKLSMKYIPGETFNSSYFVARSEDGKMKAVRASLLIPADIQKRIANKDAEVVTVDEAIDQMMKECGGTFEGFVAWLPKNASLERKAYDFFAIKQDEITTKPIKPDKDLVRALNEKEIEADKVTKPRERKIQKFFNRLPGTGPVDPEIALNLKSKLDAVTDEVTKLKADLDAATKEKEDLKGKLAAKDLKAKDDDVKQLIAAIEANISLNEESKKKLTERLSSLSEEGLGVIEEILGLNKTAKAEETKEVISAQENVPAVQIDEKGTESPLENLITVWNQHTAAKNYSSEQ